MSLGKALFTVYGPIILIVGGFFLVERCQAHAPLFEKVFTFQVGKLGPPPDLGGGCECPR